MSPKHETIKRALVGEASAKKREDLNASTVLLVKEAVAIPSDHPRQLKRGQAYNGTVNAEQLTQRQTQNTLEGITHIIIVGDTVLEVSALYNKNKGVGDWLEKVRLSKLPLGEHGDKTGVSRTLAEIDVRALNRPGNDGIVQPWKTVSIGRGDLAGGSNVDDVASTSHFDFTVRPNGSFDVLDHSTNGTTILSAEDYSQTRGALSEGGRAAFIKVAQALQGDSNMWQSSTANSASSPVTVINPY